MNLLVNLLYPVRAEIVTYLKITSSVELLLARCALVSWLHLVQFQVFAQIGSLLERFGAVWAVVWSVVGVRQEVVDEDMPIRKDFPAKLARAVQQPERFLLVFFPVLYDKEGGHIGDAELLHCPLTQVEVLAFLNEEEGIWREVFLNSVLVEAEVEPEPRVQPFRSEDDPSALERGSQKQVCHLLPLLAVSILS